MCVPVAPYCALSAPPDPEGALVGLPLADLRRVGAIHPVRRSRPRPYTDRSLDLDFGLTNPMEHRLMGSDPYSYDPYKY